MVAFPEKLEEYKMLRAEIAQYQKDNFLILQISLGAAVGLFTIAYSNFPNDNYRWLIMFIPCIIAFPASLMISQRIMNTWRIGRYLQILGEEIGIVWETVNPEERKNYKEKQGISKVPPYKGTSWLPLLLVQCLCIVLSLLQIAIDMNRADMTKSLLHFSGWLVITIVVVYTILLQKRAFADIDNYEKLKLRMQEMKKIRQEALKQQITSE